VGRLFGWIAGLVGIAALARMLARRSRVAHPPAIPAPTDDPANALRQKLAETRESAGADTPSSAETDEQSETLEERRARVHAKAHEALEAMEALEEQPR
jgi:hypothetical protein